MDEITERPARPLPAPSGPRSPTGPVPLTAPPSAIPPPVDAVAVLPFLPAIAPKAVTPPTGEVPATLATAAMLALNKPTTPSVTAPPKRKHKALIGLGVLLALALVLGVIFRDTAFVERFTGKGYDTNPLPLEAFPHPVLTAADYTFTMQSVGMADGLPTNYWRTEHDEVNFTSNNAKLTIDVAKASIIGGAIGTPQTMTPTSNIFLDKQSSYEEGQTPTDPWIRTPLDSGSWEESLIGGADVRMYQDVVDPALRSQVPTSVSSEVRRDVPVTTYTYTFPFRKFYESAPRLFEYERIMDGNAADDAAVTVTLSLDEQMVVRYLDVNVDYKSVLEHSAKKFPEGRFPYRSTFELVSLADTPPTLSVPTNVVEATTTTSTVPTTTLPVEVPAPAVTP